MIILRQKSFARKDYEGLTNKGKEELRKRRSAYAKELKKLYRNTQAGIDRVDPIRNDTLTTKGNISGGGVITRFKVGTTKDGLLPEEFIKEHKIRVTNNLLRGSEDAQELMRNKTLAKHRKTEVSKLRDEAGKVIGDNRKIRRDMTLGNENRKLAEENLEKRKAKAEELRKEKAAREAKSTPKPTSTPKVAAKEGNKILGWVKKNPGKSALGVAATAGLAYGGKKAYDHYKKKKEEK